MKPVFVLAVFLFLLSCGQTEKTPAQQAGPHATTATARQVRVVSAEEVLASMLKKFREVNFDTLELHSPDYEDKTDRFYGTALTAAEEMALTKKTSTENAPPYPAYYACYRFQMKEGKIGLIIRAPGMYSSSSIQLFIYDSGTGTFLRGAELAETWGDAGDFFQKRSWLLRQAEGNLIALVHEYFSYQHDVDDPKDAVADSSDSYYTLRIPKNDTLSKDSAVLVKAYRKLLIKR